MTSNAENDAATGAALVDSKIQIARLTGQNEKLSYTLREAREHIASLRDEVDKLTRAPGSYATVVGINDDHTVDVLTNGRKIRVTAHTDVDVEHLQLGAEVMLNDALNIVLQRGIDIGGEVVSLKEVLEDGIRAIVVVRGDDERV
jgi:proteasome-associated ATPase